MTFRVRDLMRNVLPDTEGPEDELMRCPEQSTTGKPAPPPKPCPAPSCAYNSAKKYEDDDEQGASWTVLAQLREQLHEALRA